MGMKRWHPSTSIDGNRSALEMETHTYCGMHQLTTQVKNSSLDEWRVQERWWWWEMSMRRLAMEMVMAGGMEVMVTWTAQLEVATSTQHELKQRCWLQRVSICAIARNHGEMTHQCCPGHPSNPQNVQTDPLDVNINVEGPRSNK